jgi:hypothetical protein
LAGKSSLRAGLRAGESEKRIAPMQISKPIIGRARV